MTAEHETLIVQTARACKHFIEEIGYTTPKKRHVAVLSFWMGVHAAETRLGNKADAEWLWRVIVLLIATRGWDEVVSLVRNADEALAVATTATPEPEAAE